MFLSALFAYTLEIQTMIRNSKAILTLDLLFQTKQTIFHNLFHFTTFCTDQMMVVMGTVCTSQIKARSAVTKVNLFNDLKVTQQFESAVYGSQSNLRELLLNQQEYFLCAK